MAKAKFPDRQQLAETSDLQLEIKNVGDQTIPNLAVTIYTTPAAAAAGEPKANAPVRHSPRPARPRRPEPAGVDPGGRIPEADHAGRHPRTSVDAPSAGAAAAQTDTFQFGPVRAGESKDIVWRVTPVRAGTYTVHYEVAAGLQGKAKAVTADGGPVSGEFAATISSQDAADLRQGHQEGHAPTARP